MPNQNGWIPFAGDGRNNVALDFAPEPKGVAGQIINCGRDDEIRYCLAPTFGEFRAFVADQFSRGKVMVRSQDADWLCIKGKSKQRDFLTGLGPLLKARRRKSRA